MICFYVDSDKSIPDIQPIFISVDPARDTPEAITAYLSDFHKKFIGLTGTSDEIKQATKAFRVYYQAGPKDDDNDYIVSKTNSKLIVWFPLLHFRNYFRYFFRKVRFGLNSDLIWMPRILGKGNFKIR